MARYALYAKPAGTRLRVLAEYPFELEEQLQEVLKENPSLIPAADLGLTPPLLVIGRESALTSGYADLVCIDRKGVLVIVEVKRGKEGDARKAIAQALDYGSDIWHAVQEGVKKGQEAAVVLDQLIAAPYFGSNRYPEEAPPRSLTEAAERLWASDDPVVASEDETWQAFQSNLETALVSGKYAYVIFAPEIPENVRITIEYLTATSSFTFAGVEVDRFADSSQDFELYVPRAVSVPPPVRKPATGSRPTVRISREQWLDTLTSDEARDFFRELTDCLPTTDDVEPAFTEAGYFGIKVSRPWADAAIVVWLSDSYSAGSGRSLFPRDVLRLGYYATPQEFKQVLDPWIDGLLAQFGGQDMRAKQSRYARWDIPDGRLNPVLIAQAIESATEMIRNLSDNTSRAGSNTHP
jgi:Endonuclease NucS C-terminal domain